MYNKDINSFYLTKKDTLALNSIKNFETIKKKNIDYSSIIVKKPWGYEYLFFSNNNIAITILCIEKNEGTSLHCHPNKTTSLYVLDGEIKFKTLNKNIILKSGQSTFIDKAVFHKSTAIKEGTYLMEIETPVNKQDLIRLKDNYGREGKGYEKKNSYSFNTNNYNYLSFDSSKSEHNRKKFFGKSSLSLRSINKNNNKKNIEEIKTEDLIMILNSNEIIKKTFPNYEFGKFIKKNEFISISKKFKNLNFEYFLVKHIDSKIKLTDFITNFFEKNNLDLVFLTPGDENLHFLDSIGRNEKVNFISSYNENSAGIAAEAYSILTKKTGIVLVSSGSSATEIFSSIARSWIESISVVYFVGQSSLNNEKSLRQLGNKSFDLLSSVKNITKYSIKIKKINEIKFHLEKAFYLSKIGRHGPCVIELPIDIQAKIIDEKKLQSFNSKLTANNNSNVSEINKIKKVTNLLKKSFRPLILIGKGVRLGNAELEIDKLISTVNIPILTSKNGADLIEDTNKLFFGRPGAYGQRSANFIIQNCDLLIVIGCRLSPTLIGRANALFARKAIKIVVDIDKNELFKKSIKIDYKIHLDSKIFISNLNKQLLNKELDYTNWILTCKRFKKLFINNKYDVPSVKKNNFNSNDIYPLYFIDLISKFFKKNDILVVDNNGPLMQFLLSFRFKKNQRLICSSLLEPRGFSIAASLGASFNNPSAFVYCFCEVNGFQQSLHDLQTIKDYKLPIKIILLIKNNNLIIKSTQKIFFGDRFVGTDKDSNYDLPSLLNISKSYGFDIIKLYQNINIEEKFNEFFSSNNSTILAVNVKNDQDFVSKQGFSIGDDNKLIPRPLEDMQPYVSRSFLKKYMLVDLANEN